MSGTTAERLVPDVIVVEGHRASPALREDAYQLWAWECGQNCEAVAFRLNERYALSLDGRTVRGWCKQDSWRIRYEDERAELAPELARYGAAKQLANGLPAAIAYTNAVAAGTIEGNKLRLAAAKTIMDACGFAPIRVMGDEAERPPPPRTVRIDTAGKSAAELGAIMLGKITEGDEG